MAEQVGIYIHIPFCRKKCGYCDFYSITNSSVADAYISAVQRQWTEINFRNNENSGYTVYIGGGTPSILNAGQFLKLIHLFDGIHFSEATIEVNPESADEEKMRLWKAAGITRISIGIQSFNDNILKYLGRVHDRKQALIAIDSAQKYFDNVNIDMIFGMPREDSRILKDDLKMLGLLNPQHISFYALTIEKGTPLYSRNQMKYIDQDAQYDMYMSIHRTLEEAGYIHYEISNFAKPHKMCMHNMNYWHNGKYIGLGASAVSFDGQKRYKLTANVNKFIEKTQIAENDMSDDFYEIMLGMRLKEGLPLDIFKNKANQLAQAQNFNLLEIKNDRVSPTIEGFVKNNELCALFLD